MSIELVHIFGGKRLAGTSLRRSWFGQEGHRDSVCHIGHWSCCLFFNSVLPYYIADAVSSYKWFEGMLTSNKSNAGFISGMYLKYILNCSTFVSVILKDNYKDPGGKMGVISKRRSSTKKSQTCCLLFEKWNFHSTVLKYHMMTFKFKHLVIQMDSKTQTKSLDSHKVFDRNL